VERAILDKVSAGLDYPSYPQLFGTRENPMNMNLQLLLPLAKSGCGVKVEGDHVYQTGEIIKPDQPVGVERPLFFKKFLENKKLLNKVKGLKASVTGPFTLAGYIDTQNVFTCGASKPKVVSALAEMVADACKELDRAGFSIVSVDEPFFAVMLGRRVLFDYDEGFLIETLNNILDEIRCFSSTHVCGVITPLIKKVLLKSKVDIIDHEFEARPENLRVYSRKEIEDNNKMLAFGCVSSQSLQIESVDHIKRSIKRGLDAFGGENMLFKPDCGFGGLMNISSAYDVAIQKLKNLTKAASEFKHDLKPSH